jgi:hypothetical protein
MDTKTTPTVALAVSGIQKNVRVIGQYHPAWVGKELWYAALAIYNQDWVPPALLRAAKTLIPRRIVPYQRDEFLT